MSDFNCGVTDARLDVSEGWFEPMSLIDLVNHLKTVGNYSDDYIAGYITAVWAVFNRVE